MRCMKTVKLYYSLTLTTKTKADHVSRHKKENSYSIAPRTW